MIRKVYRLPREFRLWFASGRQGPRFEAGDEVASASLARAWSVNHGAHVSSSLDRRGQNAQRTARCPVRLSGLFDFKRQLSPSLAFFTKCSDFIKTHLFCCLSVLSLFVFSLANGAHKTDRLLVF